MLNVGTKVFVTKNEEANSIGKNSKGVIVSLSSHPYAPYETDDEHKTGWVVVNFETILNSKGKDTTKEEHNSPPYYSTYWVSTKRLRAQKINDWRSEVQKISKTKAL